MSVTANQQISEAEMFQLMENEVDEWQVYHTRMTEYVQNNDAYKFQQQLVLPVFPPRAITTTVTSTDVFDDDAEHELWAANQLCDDIEDLPSPPVVAEEIVAAEQAEDHRPAAAEQAEEQQVIAVLPIPREEPDRVKELLHQAGKSFVAYLEMQPVAAPVEEQQQQLDADIPEQQEQQEQQVENTQEISRRIYQAAKEFVKFYESQIIKIQPNNNNNNDDDDDDNDSEQDRKRDADVIEISDSEDESEVRPVKKRRVVVEEDDEDESADEQEADDNNDDEEEEEEVKQVVLEEEPEENKKLYEIFKKYAKAFTWDDHRDLAAKILFYFKKDFDVFLDNKTGKAKSRMGDLFELRMDEIVNTLLPGKPSFHKLHAKDAAILTRHVLSNWTAFYNDIYVKK